MLGLFKRLIYKIHLEAQITLEQVKHVTGILETEEIKN